MTKLETLIKVVLMSLVFVYSLVKFSIIVFKLSNSFNHKGIVSFQTITIYFNNSNIFILLKSMKLYSKNLDGDEVLLKEYSFITMFSTTFYLYIIVQESYFNDYRIDFMMGYIASQ